MTMKQLKNQQKIGVQEIVLKVSIIILALAWFPIVGWQSLTLQKISGLFGQ